MIRVGVFAVAFAAHAQTGGPTSEVASANVLAVDHAEKPEKN